jgi:hypothetical protein
MIGVGARTPYVVPYKLPDAVSYKSGVGEDPIVWMLRFFPVEH